ncbi:hypothetical protein ACQSFC_25795 [Salmonella enterica]|uniref:hypothetical protein n=1 Tax=Salmonella enterica TaxID=28901 RepID=UPI003D31B4A5|nr:hypothetical protein [Salmonella enterica]
MLARHYVGFIRKNTAVEKSYFQIDPKIQRLVACMNTCGMKTYASCQVHGFPVRKRLPYVAFMAPQPLAQRLARLVREDAESLSPRLNQGWEVTAHFNSQFRLCWRLAPENPHLYGYRYWRKTLDKDFQQLCLLISSASLTR